MANLVTYVNTLLKPYYKYITGLFLLVLFILISKFLYDAYFVKYHKNINYKNVANAKNTKDICSVYFFSVDWCPHCKKAKPEWDAFKKENQNKIINGYILKCYDIDCTEDNGDEVMQFDILNPTNSSGESNEIPIKSTPIKLSEIINKYNIDSYPTIKLTKGDMVVDFDSKITKDTLTQFVFSV